MSSNKIKPTLVADKMLSIICGIRNLRKSEINTKTTWQELNVSNKDRDVILNRIAESFLIYVGDHVKLNMPDPKTNKHKKDLWPLQKEKIKTVWNVLQFIEANDDYRGKPAAYNLH